MSSTVPALTQAKPTPADRTTQLAQTVAYYAAFIALGLVSALFGPTLSGLAAHTGSTLSAISAIFAANSFGRLIGSLLCGRLLDRVKGHPIAVAGFIMLAVLMAIAPLALMLWLLILVFFLLGVAENLIDVSVNTLIVWVHGIKVGPFMNGLHLMYGVGAFVVPIIAAGATAFSGDINLPYWIVAAAMLPMAIWLLRLPSPTHPHQATASHVARGRAHRPLMFLIALFFFVAVGAEAGMNAWTFNYGAAIGLDRATLAAALASTYWGAYSLGRLLAIPISIRVAPRTMLIADVVGLVLSAGILLFGRTLPFAAWVGTFGIGLSLASVFPTMLTYAGSRMNATGKVNGFLFSGSTLGAMFFPWLIGQLFEPAGPQSLAFIVLFAAIAALIVFIGIDLASRKTATSNHASPEYLS